MARDTDDLEEVLAELGELIAIPTVSADPGHHPDIRAGAEWISRFVERSGGSATVAGDGALVIGEIAAAKAAGEVPTVAVYGHFDVQPPEPLDQWQSDPFVASVRDGWLYGRGATDDKGQFFMLLRAVAELVKTGSLPVNVLVIGDGEEEVGGTAAWSFLRNTSPQVDAAVVFDGPSDTGAPEIVLATRGLVSVDVRVTTGEIDLHSGHYGGVALNAVHALAEALAEVLPRDGVLRDELASG